MTRKAHLEASPVPLAVRAMGPLGWSWRMATSSWCS